jgi:hypothetical protein
MEFGILKLHVFAVCCVLVLRRNLHLVASECYEMNFVLTFQPSLFNV